MKIWNKAFLLAASALMLAGCGSSTTSDKDVVDAVAKNDALVVNGAGGSYTAARDNDLSYGTALYLAKSWAVDAKVEENKEIVNKTVTATITWAISGEGAERWKFNTAFDPDQYHAYVKGTYPASGESAVKVTFTGTIVYGSATKDIVYNFTMLPKA